MKFAAGITLYNPTLEEIKNINAYANVFDKVWVYDNTENIERESIIKHLDKRILYMTRHVNDGLPYAFNKIINQVTESKYDFLCTLDQDSLFKSEEIEKIKNICEKIDLNKTGIIGPFIIYGEEKKDKEEVLESRKWVITSGAFLNIRLIEKYNMRYDENYFIDKFEIDLCEQMRRKGFKILMYHGAILKQRLGESSEHRHPNHNPERHYYLFRNRFYFNKKYKNNLEYVVYTCLQTFRHLVLIVLYENNKIEKMMMLKKAYCDFKKNNMGKLKYQ